MNYIIGALAVYKIVQVIDVLAPKEAMAWVKIVFALLTSFGVVALLGMPNIFVAGCAVATLAGTVQTVLRLLVLLGDVSQRKVIR
jgi:hypothetical protein